MFWFVHGFFRFAFCLRSSRGHFRASFSDSLTLRVRPVALEEPRQSRTTKNEAWLCFLYIGVPKEKEVLLEEVLEDLEEVFKLEEDRGQGEHGGGVEHWVDNDHTLPSQDVEAHFSARPADGARLALANSRMFGTNGAYASVRARIGDTRRILDLRTSGEAAEWCGAHIADTRRRMDRASTVAPSSRASTVETIETQDSTTEAH